MKEIKYLICLFALSIVLISVVPAGAKTCPSHGVLNWKGQNWYLTGGQSNPGNNYWNNAGAWIDNQNRLHLTIVKDKCKWKCTMLNSQCTYLYGTFTWTIDSPVYCFDKNSVVGLCTYLDDYHELDIETSRWGETRGNQLWYSVQPSKIEGNSRGYLVPSRVTGTKTIYRIEWKPDYVRFTSMQANGKIIADYNYTNVSGIPKQPESIIMNLWLMAPPSNGKNIELIISDFTITNYSTTKVAKSH
jgi:endo-1,3-1,4-beta-glycanase ExoK